MDSITQSLPATHSKQANLFKETFGSYGLPWGKSPKEIWAAELKLWQSVQHV